MNGGCDVYPTLSNNIVFIHWLKWNCMLNSFDFIWMIKKFWMGEEMNVFTLKLYARHAMRHNIKSNQLSDIIRRNSN